MKKIFVSLLLIAVAVATFAQTTDNRILFTVGGEKVTVSDFEYVYNKNNINNQANYSDTSLNNYLGLYENFRLKVREAEAMKLDTLANLKTELEGYRKQLAKSYLSDREITDKLILEAYERSKKEVNASHILVKCDENANPADTLAAYKKILALRKRIEKGESFEQVAKEASEDPSARTNSGNIGWFTVFGTIYPFENAAYTLKKGELSQPVRTEFGYHLVKVNNTRVSRGQVHVEHIMVRFPEKATTWQIDSIHHKIDSIYKLITTKKLSFEDAVKDFSDDKGSRGKNGELPWFGTGAQTRMMPEFEDAAFAIEKDGDISAPVKTTLGWHIIKRIERKELPSFNDAKTELKKKVERDSRSEEAKTVLVNRIKKENAFSQNAETKADFIKRVDTTIAKGNWHPDSLLRNSKKTLFTLAGKQYTEGDFAEFIAKTAKRRSDKNKNALLNEYYENFVNTKCLEFEEGNLEAKKPEFKNLMKEYKDGILLFELMDRMVWTKAVKDTDGLEAFRQKNSGKYMWGNRADVVIFNVNDKATADEAYKMAGNKASVEEIQEKINNRPVTVETKIDEKAFAKKDWGTETLIFDQGGLQVYISFLQSGKSCKKADDPNKYRFTVKGNLRSLKDEVLDCKISYTTCQGTAAQLSASINIGTNGKTGVIEKPEYVFAGKSVEKVVVTQGTVRPHVSAITGKYEKGQYDVVDKIEWKQGLTPIKTLSDSTYQFILVKQIVGPEPKSLKEAKGYIVSDYQEYLEKTWLETLKNKYPIKLDETVFKSLVKKPKK